MFLFTFSFKFLSPPPFFNTFTLFSMHCIPRDRRGYPPSLSSPRAFPAIIIYIIINIIYCWKSLFLWRTFSPPPASPEGSGCSQHPTQGLESPGLRCYQQEFVFKAALISCLHSVLFVHICIFSILCILEMYINFKIQKSPKKKKSDHFYLNFLIKTLEEFQPICTKLSEKVENTKTCRLSNTKTFCVEDQMEKQLFAGGNAWFVGWFQSLHCILKIHIFYKCVCIYLFVCLFVYFYLYLFIFLYFVCFSIIIYAYTLVLSLFYICIYKYGINVYGHVFIHNMA